MRFKKYLTTLVILAFCTGVYVSLSGYSGGITGVTKKNGSGCTCHNPSPTVGVTPQLLGPSTVKAGDTATYRLKIKGGPLVAAGCNIAVQTGSLLINGTDLQKISGELTHTAPKTPVGDSVVFTFKYIAPNNPNTKDSIYANGNSVNLNGNNSGDSWNFATNFVITVTPPTSVQQISGIVDGFSLAQNYPNPFNPSTKINFSIPKSGYTTLKVYDILGNEITSLVDDNLSAGSYTVNFNTTETGKSLSSGIYFYRLTASEFTEVKKMYLVK
jgi:hypothetical protein